jgi:large subunit ribosomal protein L15e
MGAYQEIRKIWKQPKKNLGDLWKQRLIQWRRENSVTKIDYPTRLDRARNLGYKAKKGYFMVRVKLLRGGRMRPQFKSGRSPKKTRRKKIVKKSYQWIAEERANKKHPNCEVLDSYYVAKDGRYYWYEIILLDKEIVKLYPKMGWVGDARGRVYRGLTSAAKKSRGLTGKGFGFEKIRPGLRANKRLGK